jgi:hypothetical protein
MACQKMANGFATTEELAGKAGVLVSHEGMRIVSGVCLCWLCLVACQQNYKLPPACQL